jgi:hypothetical protein
MKTIFEDVIRVHLFKYVERRRAFVKRPASKLQGISQPISLILCKRRICLYLHHDGMEGEQRYGSSYP